MTYYVFIENNKISGLGQTPCANDDVINYEISQNVYNAIIEDSDKYIWNGTDIIANPDYDEVVKRRERNRLDALALTPADVERALYRAKDMDFDDLIVLIAQRLPQVDIKGLSIEFRAKDFYRGAEAGGVRLFDTVGQLLGYTSDDMDYLFEHKELPSETSADVT